jgi:hypothetical protein
MLSERGASGYPAILLSWCRMFKEFTGDTIYYLNREFTKLACDNEQSSCQNGTFSVFYFFITYIMDLLFNRISNIDVQIKI